MREEEIIAKEFARNGIMVRKITSVWKPNGEQTWTILTYFGSPQIVITADEHRNSPDDRLEELVSALSIKASEGLDA